MNVSKREIGIACLFALATSACSSSDDSGQTDAGNTTTVSGPSVDDDDLPGEEEEGEAPPATADPTTTTSDTLEETSTTAGTAPPESTTTTTTDAPETTTTLPSEMPSLVGRQIAEVRAELSQYNVRVTEVALIDPAPAGSIVDQDPLPGERFSTSVTLVVSVAPPPVPNLVGLSAAEARVILSEDGFTIRETEQLDEIARDGEVLAQDPPPGAENEGEVVLTIARRPVVVNLRGFASVDNGNTRYGTFKANAVSYPDSFQFFNGFDERDLSRGFRRLVAEFGVEDDDPIDTIVTIRVLGDNRVLFEDSVGFGQTKVLDVDVTDVLRLRIESDRLEGSGTLILGTPRLFGLEGEVPES